VGRRRAHSLDRLWRLLGGDDGPGRTAVPAGELFHPIAVAAALLLIVNDHLLKGSRVPGWLTGKLSDVAGLAVFPLVVTAAADSLAWLAARAGAPLDFTLRRWKLGAAVAATAALFAAIKLWPAAGDAVAGGLGRVFGHARIIPDRTDLLALPALAVSWWIGRRELRRIPLGRLEYLIRRHRRGRAVTGGLADAIRCGADPAQVAAVEAALLDYLDGGPPPPLQAALASVRDPDGAAPGPPD